MDGEAGPVARPYTLTQGRTGGDAPVDLIGLVVATARPVGERLYLGPEHLRLRELCRRPTAVADLASEVDLPLGVVRVLLGDLLAENLVELMAATPAGQAPDDGVLRNLLNGLRAL